MAPVALEEGAVEQSAGDVSEASAPPAWTWRDSSASPCAAPPPDGTPLKKTHRMRKGPEGHLVRAGSLVDSVRGDPLKRAQSNLALQGASTLPTEDQALRHAATMPIAFDVQAERPFCCGLWKVQQFVGLLLGCSMFVAFATTRSIHTYPLANDMLGLTSLCACFWIFEVIPVYITALFPLIFIPFMEIASSEYIAHAYWNWISLLVVSTFLMDIALWHVQLPRRLALSLLLRVGVVRPATLLASFMALSWFLAMFVNSIAVALLITPFAVSLVQAAEEHVRNTAEAAGEGNAEEGLSVDSEAVAAAGNRGAAEVQRLADGLLLGIAYGASVGGVGTLTGSVPNYFLAAESILAGHLDWALWSAFAMPISIAVGALAYIALFLRYIWGLKFTGATQEVLEREYQDFIEEVGPLSRDEILVGAAQLMQTILLVIRPYAVSPLLHMPTDQTFLNDATLAAIPPVLLFFVPSQVRPGQALLTWPVVHERFNFGLLLLIGGSMAINAGFTNSGLDIPLGDALAKVIPLVHPAVLDLVIVTVVAISCQVLSSIGVATMMLPILSSAAVQATVHPLALMLPATVAASFSFILPTATPPNVVVLAKSQELARPLRFYDFFTNGVPLTLVAIVVGSFLSHFMGAVVFQDNTPLPQWACEAAGGAECTWVALPGVAHGMDVTSQACVVDTSSAGGDMCRIWNGTMVNVTQYMRGR